MRNRFPCLILLISITLGLNPAHATWLQELNSDWSYESDLGWIYSGYAVGAEGWYHHDDLEWFWTNEDAYPWVYSPATPSWVYVQGSTQKDLYLFDMAFSASLQIPKTGKDFVSRETGSYDWRHREFTASDENELLGWTRNVVTTTFDTEIIENDLIRVTLLPGWGARILSIYYKPMDIELLSYAKEDRWSDLILAGGAFYYDDWLLLPGGINPTFPEGEHGKYWGLPWDVSIIEDTEDVITIRMSRTDDIDWLGTPGKFNNGLTGMTVDMDVSVYPERAATEITYTLTNNKSETIAYEFWTAAQLAPLPPEESSTSSNLEIVMNQEKIILRDFWNWMSSVETDDENTSDDVYLFDELAWMYNWKNAGIAYAYPLTDNTWWGVINHDYDWGVLRTTDDPNNAPGMKIWGEGTDYGLFELWSGNSSEFFEDAFLGPNEVLSWKETFIPTVGLSAIDEATSYGAIDVEALPSEGLAVNLFSTEQPAAWRLEVYGTPADGEREFIASYYLRFTPEAPVQSFTVPFSADSFPLETTTFEIEATDFFTGEARLDWTVAP